MPAPLRSLLLTAAVLLLSWLSLHTAFASLDASITASKMHPSTPPDRIEALRTRANLLSGLWLLMQLVTAVPLAALLRQWKPNWPRRAFFPAIALAAALSCALILTTLQLNGAPLSRTLIHLLK
ncbi:MAG: hypothetical protein M9913_23845 [Bryobacteraceae bacterium]|nr:hypothetical protein [Solibacteraceae bacterium]MCO5353869.1 hypothetical protein [Bryobacteraceae bacterium]